jgi:site-specific DNA-cytosine methylase
MNEQNKTVAEFFAGIGLMRIGLENAGWPIAECQMHEAYSILN